MIKKKNESQTYVMWDISLSNFIFNIFYVLYIRIYNYRNYRLKLPHCDTLATIPNNNNNRYRTDLKHINAQII